MAVSKVAYDGHTLIDLTGDTATAADVTTGKKFHLANGEQATGTNTGGITPSGTININSNGIHDVTSYANANVNVSGADPVFSQHIDLTCDVVDGTYQLSLSLAVRSNSGNNLIWDNITPDEHEEDGYYNYTADFKLIGGSGEIKDGFYITCSNGFDLDQYTKDTTQYIEVYHSGIVRTWYFFVPPSATTFYILFTP